MTTFVNHATPYLRILLPSGDYIQFQGGKLIVDEDDPNHEHAMAEAVRNQSIAILVNETTCDYCGESFTGDKARAKLADHKKDVHFDLWQKETELEQARVVQREVKARAGYACDVCAPVQTFGSEDDLAEHVRLLHTAPPELDENGNTVGGGGGDDGGQRPGGEVAATPVAAKPSTRAARPASRTAAARSKK